MDAISSCSACCKTFLWNNLVLFCTPSQFVQCEICFQKFCCDSNKLQHINTNHLVLNFPVNFVVPSNFSQYNVLCNIPNIKVEEQSIKVEEQSNIKVENEDIHSGELECNAQVPFVNVKEEVQDTSYDQVEASVPCSEAYFDSNFHADFLEGEINTEVKIENDPSIKEECTESLSSIDTFSEDAMCPEIALQNLSPTDEILGEVGSNLDGTFHEEKSRSSDGAPEKPHSTCHICLKQFPRPRALRMHIRRHVKGKPYSCHLCSKRFFSPSCLKVHIRFHTGEKPYSCSVCSKAFVTKGGLKSHMKVHTGERPFSCPICKTSFGQKIGLQTHLRTHTGEKPFRCNACDQSFTSARALRVHHYRHAGIKLFQCEFCARSFYTKSDLKRHPCYREEKEYICEFCDKIFNTLHRLKVHTRTHTGEQKYCCDVCGRKFSSLSQLKDHVFTHFGIKPHKCNICSKSYTQRHNLNIHMKSHSVSCS